MPRKRYLDERDRDIYEAEIAEDAERERRERAHDAGTAVADRFLRTHGRVNVPEGQMNALAHHIVDAALEGYDPDRDDPNGWVNGSADDRERDLKGEQ